MLRISLSRRLALPAILILLMAGAVAWPPARTQAQATFNSGSTGADGAFSPTSSQSIQVPAGGVFNFLTVNIPSGVTITFTRNAANTPVTILASGNVTIAGTISVAGQNVGSSVNNGGLGGPGGFNGGQGGYGFSPYAGVAGEGPGAGTGGGSVNGGSLGSGGGGHAGAGANGGGPTAGQGGATYGSATGIPFIGGSGGGGAILIASSGTITITGRIDANGGGGASFSNGANGGGGSGGLIRLMANTITGTNGFLNVAGGSGGSFGSPAGGNGGVGFIRVEAFDRNSFTPSSSTNPISYGLPGSVTIANAPRLRITSIGGIATPASPLGLPDVTLPAAQSNPVSVMVEATNVPLSTAVQVSVIPSAGTRASFPCGQLTGSDTLSTGTANVTLPAGMSVLVATAIIDTTIAGIGPIFMDGERVTRMEIAASLGGVSQVTYVTASGKRITRSE
jgi:hypothetical protein